MNSLKFSEIYFTKDAENFPLSKKIFSAFKTARKIPVESPKELYFSPQNAPEKVSQSKKALFLTVKKNNFIEKCPGTKEHLCCNYFVAKNILGCPADCSYCYLQAYLNIRAITVFVNTNDFLRDFEKAATGHTLRIGTGEFSDSLFLDNVIDVNKSLIEICSRTDSLLELKTKSADVTKLLKLNHRGKTVMAWSLNPFSLAKTEEKGTSPPSERISAAAQCSANGYPVAFHFDPLIDFNGWEKAYEELIERLFAEISPKNIAWISLGALRYDPKIKPVIYSRFPDSKILCGEFVRGNDGKDRYLKYTRMKMFSKINGFLKKFDRNMKVYLCMETPEVWKHSFGKLPSDIPRLNSVFTPVPRAHVEKNFRKW
ncbi:MAG: DNA photolyase [Elusimicrobiota bacterium]|nr:DNA photolyase [Elusimicrobiota bacterium]